ncbi:peptidase G1 [Boletus reticuloceps]|uniref:Peptidase G1 n=1 Tax=Boletus reticuloceps TaxID=495285 RepID=A0A8I2YG01_9AGAM|nr:peptidase G1 [Boletus reticuloceps]
MRLNSALASSFSFVPIVLAGWFHEVPWAGAVLSEGNEGTYTAAIGSFNVPSASGDHGMTIVVGIGGRGVECDIAFAAGIDVLVYGNVVSYVGWATWGAQTVTPLKFDISQGDIIRAGVYVYSTTTGSALLENLTNGEAWWEFFITDEPMVCQRSAEWVVTPLANYLPRVPTEIPIPKFSEVTFLNATAEIAGGAYVTPGPGGAYIINNIEYNNIPLTTGTVYKDTVVIASTM